MRRARARSSSALRRAVTAALALWLAVALSIAIAPAVARGASPPTPAERGAERLAVSLIADARAKAGLAPLREDTVVDAVARARADDMRARGYFGHVAPDGTTAFDLLDRSGIPWTAASEVIGWNDLRESDASARMVVAAWLASAEHHEILMAPDPDTIGVASSLDAGTGRRTWVAVLASVPPPAPAVTVSVSGRTPPDRSGARTAMIAWAARTGPDRLPVASVAVQVRLPGGRWALVAAAATRSPLRIRARTRSAFSVRLRPRASDGTLGGWTVVTIAP